MLIYLHISEEPNYSVKGNRLYSIYHSKKISLAEAASLNKKVKVTTVSDKKYVFKRIKKDEEVVYGSSGKNSKAAIELNDNIIEDNFDDNLVKIGLNDI